MDLDEGGGLLGLVDGELAADVMDTHLQSLHCHSCSHDIAVGDELPEHLCQGQQLLVNGADIHADVRRGLLQKLDETAGILLQGGELAAFPGRNVCGEIAVEKIHRGERVDEPVRIALDRLGNRAGGLLLLLLLPLVQVLVQRIAHGDGSFLCGGYALLRRNS